MIKLLKTPGVILITVFYLYFGYINLSIYQLDYIGWPSFFLIPRMYFQSFSLFLCYALTLTILSRWRKVYNGLLLLIFPLTLIYILQYFSLYYSRNYLIPEAIVEYKAVSFFLTTNNIVKTAVFLAISIIAYFTLRINENYLNSWLRIFLRSTFVLLLFAGSFVSYYLVQRYTENYASSFPRPKSSPEFAFFTALNPQPPAKKPSFSAVELLHLKDEYHLEFQNSTYPYFSEPKFQPDSLFVSNHNPTGLNIVIFFIESLSSRFIGSYNEQFSTLTPNINAFANKSLQVEGYYNHSIPTINGLVGTLCSIYPHFRNEDFEDKEQTFNIYSLAHILNAQGYSSSVFCYENKGFPLFRIMNKMGFQNRYFKQDIEEELQIKPNRTDYLNDEFIFDYYLHYLENYKDTATTPFFHIVTTVDTHSGHELPQTIKQFETGEYATLNAIHNLDLHFGRFSDWFFNSTYKDNTIVILTADHSLPFGAENAELYRNRPQAHPMFDELALIMYIPEKEATILNTHSSSISLAPTVLDLLHIADVSTNFLGKSIFSQPYSENLIGTYASTTYSKNIQGEFESSNDTILNKWGQLNRFLFRNNQIAPGLPNNSSLNEASNP